MQLHALPAVLVLHLRRWGWSHAAGAVKLHKAVAFGAALKLPPGLLSETCPERRAGGAEYQLISTVSHHGRSLAGGHYTADALQPDGRWLHLNDAAVNVVPLSAVLHERAYLLFYQRVR